MSNLNRKLAAAFAAPLLLLAAAGAAQAGPQGSGLAFTQEVDWQRRHAVLVKVADLKDRDQQSAAKRAVDAVSGVQRVTIDRQDATIKAVPFANRRIDPLAVRAALAATGYQVTDPQ